MYALCRIRRDPAGCDFPRPPDAGVFEAAACRAISSSLQSGSLFAACTLHARNKGFLRPWVGCLSRAATPTSPSQCGTWPPVHRILSMQLSCRWKACFCQVIPVPADAGFPDFGCSIRLELAFGSGQGVTSVLSL
jgi:hypothetical protein